MRILIVDDELSGREVLLALIHKYCSKNHAVTLCDSVAAAKKHLEQIETDLVFLDIEMPVENGFDLFQYFPAPTFQVVFTTAHQHYAIQAFKYAALDYLVKPVRPKQLQKAIQRAQALYQEKTAIKERIQLLQDSLVNPFQKIAIPTIDGFLFVNMREIIRIESDVNYSKIILQPNQSYTSAKTLKEYEELLEPFNFVRIHRSHLINLNYIRAYQKGRTPILEMDDGTELPIAANRKKEFLEYLNKL